MADKHKVQMIMALVKGEDLSRFSGRCPVFEFKDGVFDVDEDGNPHGELIQVGWQDFAPGFELINMPLTEKDRREIEDIKQGQ